MDKLVKQNDNATFTTDQIFGFHPTPPGSLSTLVTNSNSLGRTLGSSSSEPFGMFSPITTTGSGGGIAAGTSQGQGSGTLPEPLGLEDISDEEYCEDEDYDEDDDDDEEYPEWAPDGKDVTASLAAELLQVVPPPPAKGSASKEALEASAAQSEKVLQDALIRLRQKYGTARWNEADLEECGRVIYDGPSYNNTISSIVQAKNLLNLYKSSLPCPKSQSVEFPDGAEPEVKV